MSKVGPVMQIAYVVEDMEVAIKHWNSMGVGPFFLLRNMEYAEQTYRGTLTDCKFIAAFAYTGDIQIELVQQLDDKPSCFNEFIQKHGYGQQHLGILSADMDADTQRLTDKGYKQLHRLLVADGNETILFDSELHAGTVLELIRETPLVLHAFQQMKAAADAWDGTPGFIEV